MGREMIESSKMGKMGGGRRGMKGGDGKWSEVVRWERWEGRRERDEGMGRDDQSRGKFLYPCILNQYQRCLFLYFFGRAV
jgi:hypothetical protein